MPPLELKNRTLFQCPHCKKMLSQCERQYYCPNGHSFDIARQGYVNLLLHAHTGQGNPGDSKEMLASRREFLDKGYYEDFSNKLNDMTIEALHGKIKDSQSISILDAGCGEGYYISRLKASMAKAFIGNNEDIYGTDVSKTAVQYAANRDKSIRFAVASNYHLPVMEGTLDLILCIFAPRDEKEFLRVLKPNGILIIAAPGPRHLYSMRRLLYNNPEYIGIKGTAGERFKLLTSGSAEYSIILNSSQDIANLFVMTPYSRHADMEAMERLKSSDSFETEVDILIRVYRKI